MLSPILQPNHETHPFVHHRTFLPWHPAFPPPSRRKSVTHVSGTFCYLSLRPLIVQFRWGSNSCARIEITSLASALGSLSSSSNRESSAPCSSSGTFSLSSATRL